MKKIDLTAGADGGEAAFDAGKMEAAGLNDAALTEALADRLRPFAHFLKDGCGVGISLAGGRASVFGLKNAASPPDSE